MAPVLNVTTPNGSNPGVWIVNTFVIPPTTRGNVWPALKKNAFIGTPIGMFVNENANGGGPA